MTKFFSVFVCLFLFGCDQLTTKHPSTRAAHRLVGQFVKEMKVIYSVAPVSINESGSREVYNSLSVDFLLRKKITKSQARALLVDMNQRFIEKINNDPEFSQYMDPKVFTPIESHISLILEKSDGQYIVYPDISDVMSNGKEMIYHTSDPENPIRYKTTESEPYEEAVRKAEQYLKTHDLARELQGISGK